MRKLARIILAVGLILPAQTPFLFANQDGTSTAAFLRIGQGARAEGMGGAFTALADDAHAVYWNPAGLAQISRHEIALNHTQYIEKINSQFAALVLPVNKINGSLGIGTTYVDMGTIERRDATGATTGGTQKVDAYAGALSWGQAVGDRLALGVGIKFINQNLAGETGSGIAGDLGALFFAIPNRLALGVSALNVGAKIKTGTTEEDIPRTISVGAVFHLIPSRLVLAADGEKEAGTDTKLHLGGEYTFQGRYVLRAGFQDNKGAGGGLSAGFGYLWRPRSEGSTDFFGKSDGKSPAQEGMDVRIDYAYVDLGDFSSTHRIGLHFAF